VQLSLSFGTECQSEVSFFGHHFWGGDGWFASHQLANWSSQRGAPTAANRQLATAKCQVQCQIAETFLATKREALEHRKINAKNKRLKTRTGRDGWMNQQLASAPFGATSGGFSTWLAGHTFPLFQLPATRCRPSSWGITQRRSAQETPLGSTLSRLGKLGAAEPENQKITKSEDRKSPSGWGSCYATDLWGNCSIQDS